MRKLRFLYLNKVNLTGSFEYTLDALRYMCWNQCPLECLPRGFYPQNLVILELPCSNMKTLWELNMASYVFGKLKTLNMSDSSDLTTTPDFTKLPGPEILDLHGCRRLETVHLSIGSLGKLVSLNLKGCMKLRSLPDSICKLRALEVLTITKCNSLKAIPRQLGNIISLTTLKAGRLTVSKFPDWIGNLTKLVELNLSHNEKLESLPDSTWNLRSLEILCINGCAKLEILPNELWKLTRLRELNANGATLLKKLPDIGSSQTALSLHKLILSFSGITALPSGLSQLSNLQQLDINACHNLLTIPELPPNLETIGAYYCSSLKRFPNLSNLKRLKRSSGFTYLNYSYCSGLKYIQGMEKLFTIRMFELGLASLADNYTKQLFQVSRSQT